MSKVSTFSGVKQLEYEDVHSPQFSAEVKNDWSYTSILLTSVPLYSTEDLRVYAFTLWM
jgi:hypothetical protein